MPLTEKIQRQLEKLPEPAQAEVLDFVEFLLSRSEPQADGDWSSLSLAAAMRGMEAEETPPYTSDDLQLRFA